MKKIIIDVDTGVDDAIGIMLAASRKDIKVLGIIAVNGNVSLDKAYINTKRILKFIGKDDIKVYKGSSKPLNKEPFNAEGIHGVDGLAGQLLDLEIIDENLDGIRFLKESIESNYGEIDIIVTGPITNLALVLKDNPELVSGIKSLTVMTGAFEVEGNVTDYAEFNAYADPDALKLVLDSGLKDIRLIGLDITKKTLLSPKHVESINNDKIRSFVYDLTENYMNRYLNLHGMSGCAMHDPLAVGTAITGDFVSYKECEIMVDVSDSEKHGCTEILGTDSPNASVGLEVESEDFLEYLISSISQL